MAFLLFFLLYSTFLLFGFYSFCTFSFPFHASVYTTSLLLLLFALNSYIFSLLWTLLLYFSMHFYSCTSPLSSLLLIFPLFTSLMYINHFIPHLFSLTPKRLPAPLFTLPHLPFLTNIKPWLMDFCALNLAAGNLCCTLGAPGWPL